MKYSDHCGAKKMKADFYVIMQTKQNMFHIKVYPKKFLSIPLEHVYCFSSSSGQQRSLKKMPT